uniref:DUF4283 domain-containing protein n=1 Tax=Quercus lobata TaxID=97700 RepID=A0A7N2M9T7_QUELO
MGEPWSFDRHLVVLQRYDGILPMEKVDFSKSSFWVQIHNLPLSWLTPDVAMEIGESLGDVNKFFSILDMLSIKGSLKFDDQQFGYWIRAAQVNPSRKSVMDVKGFGKKDTQRHLVISSITGTSSSTMHEGIVSLRPVSGIVEGLEFSVGVDSKTVMELPPGATNKEEPITLNENKLPVVANVINVACVSSNSLNGKDCVTWSKENLTALRSLGSHGKEASCVTMGSQDIGIKIDPKSQSSSETLSIQHSYHEKDCHTYPNHIVAVMEQGEQKLNANVVMVMDIEKEKKLKLEKESNEQGDILTSQLGSVEAVEQTYWEALEWLELKPISPSIIAEMQKTRVKLNCWLEKDDAMWLQRSRINWFQEGDRNTRYFYSKTSAQFKNNIIDALFSSSNPTDFMELLDAVEPKVTNAMNQMLLRDFQEFEVKTALK